MKINIAMVALTMCLFSYAQVGINTINPKATLDVQRQQALNLADGVIPPRISGDSLRLKSNAYSFPQNGAIVYVTSPVTNPDASTEPKTQDVESTGFFVYDANYVHPNSSQGIWNKVTTRETGWSKNTYAAKFNGNITLLNLGIGLFNNDFLTLPLSTTSNVITNEIPSSQIIDNEYIVPSDGIYQINYSYRTASGVSAELLSGGTPGVAILKTGTDNARTILDFREFGGINLINIVVAVIPVVVSITLTQGQITHIYNLKAGEKLRFGIIRGGVNLGLVAQRSAEISIYKIR